MIPNNNNFVNDLPELSAKDLKKGGGISFLTKRERLELQLNRLDDKQKKIDDLKQKKQADLLLLDGENSDDDFFQYKINHRDWEIL